MHRFTRRGAMRTLAKASCMGLGLRLCGSQAMGMAWGVGPAVAASPSYVAHELLGPAGQALSPIGVNDGGQVAGSTVPTAPGAPASGFIGTLANGFVLFQAFGADTHVLAVNQGGVVVGTYAGPDGDRAFIRTPDHTVTDLFPAQRDPDVHMVARAINDKSVVVGDYVDHGAIYAFTWSLGEGHVLGPKFVQWQPAAINNRNVVAGNGRWYTHGNLRTLPNPDLPPPAHGRTARGRAINVGGTIVGGSGDFTTSETACRWDGGAVSVLQGLSKHPSLVSARAISLDGRIVGSAVDPWNSGVSQAVSFDPTGAAPAVALNAVTSLPDGTWLTDAVGVNVRGFIAAQATRGGLAVGYLLEPAP